MLGLENISDVVGSHCPLLIVPSAVAENGIQASLGQLWIGRSRAYREYAGIGVDIGGRNGRG
ncbi:hypothetical protein D3C80_2176430 [compost metagenome]